MTYLCGLCGVEVIGRVVWIELGVRVAEERCPACGRWAKFYSAAVEPLLAGVGAEEGAA